MALVIGVIGAAFGAAAVVADLPALGLVAGGAALLAGLVALLGARTDVVRDDPEAAQILAERDELLDSTRGELAAAHQRIAELESDIVEATEADDPGADQADAAILTDPASQLFSEAYFRVALQSRLA